MRRCPPPPTPIIFERLKLPQQIIYRRKENLLYNLFREIFKFREDKSNNVFREIRKCFRKTAKFKFFAKQIIYLESPNHPLQNDI